MNIASHIVQTIGSTPLVRLEPDWQRTEAPRSAPSSNFSTPWAASRTASARAMIDAAESDGRINPRHPDHRAHQWQHRHRPGLCLRGQGLPAVSDHAGNHERRAPQTADAPGRRTGADPRRRGDERRHRKGRAIARPSDAEAFMPDQFDNPANPEVHRETTAEEIWRRHRRPGGHPCRRRRHRRHHHRVAEALKARKPDFKAVAVEPADSPVLSGGQPGPHKIQGIGAGFVPRSWTGRHRRGDHGRPTKTPSRPPGSWPPKEGHAGRHLLGRGRLGRPAGGRPARKPASALSSSCPAPASAT